MKHRACVLSMVTLLMTACSASPEPAADVARSAFSIRGDRIGIGAVVRVDGERALRDIVLQVTFRTAGATLGVETDTLPYCPPTTDCPWGRMLFGDEISERWRDITAVDVAVVRTSGAVDSSRTLRRLRTRVLDDAVNVEQDGREGTAYVLAYQGRTPDAGYSFFTARGERSRLRYGPLIVPRLDGDRFETVLYPGVVGESRE